MLNPASPEMTRFGTVMCLFAVALVAGGTGCNNSDSTAIGVLNRGLRAADQAIAIQSGSLAAECREPGASTWAGLTIDRGRVVAARVLDEIDGFAKTAGTTGGLGGELTVVTTLRDYDSSKAEAPIAGSLRAAVERAAREKLPMWIVFAKSLGPAAVLHAKKPFRLPDNITLDGTCSDVTFESPANIGQVYVFGTHNVIVQRLTFRKTGYMSMADEGDTESAIRLNGLFDKVAILHNDLSKCGDGCIDITTSPGKPVPEAARVTVAFNRITDHDKTMLFGTFTCGDKGVPLCDARYLAANTNMPPALHLTLEGNLFLRTSQRHPRVFGRVMAHIVNNIMALAPLPRKDGSFSDCNGVFVSNAARAFVERNLFVPLRRNWTPFWAVWTTVTPGAERMPEDTEGFIRLVENAATTKTIMKENRPELVGNPEYSQPLRALAFEKMKPEQAVACVAGRAGTRGATEWLAHLCTVN
jgi:pectate lyase